MSKQTFEKWLQASPRRTAILVLVGGPLLAWVPISCDMRAEKRELAEKARIETAKLAEEAREQEFAERAKNEDTAEASRRGITYEEFKQAEELTQEHIAPNCKKLVDAAAKWGAEWNFLRDYRWSSNKEGILLWGNDVKLLNAFNAKSRASYACKYVYQTKQLSLEKLE